MKLFKTLLGALGLLGAGAASQGAVNVAYALTQDENDVNVAGLSSEEIELRACEKALQANSIEALEEFLNKYPRSNACKVLALNALNAFSGDENRGPSGPNPGPNPGNGYGG